MEMSKTKEVNKMAGTDSISEAKEFSFAPRAITDVSKMHQIIDAFPVWGPYEKDGEFRLCFRSKKSPNMDDYCLTVVGREFLKRYAASIVEIPFVCITHKYHYKSECRAFSKKIVRLEDLKYYPPDVCQRENYKDVWNDASFFALYEDKNGEVSSTCRITKCSSCDGGGKVKEWYAEDVKEWDVCPVCDGSGMVGIRVCKRCDGSGRAIVHKSRGNYSMKECNKCKGKGKIKTILKAEYKKEEGDVGWSFTGVVQDPPVVPYWKFGKISWEEFKNLKEGGALSLIYKKKSAEGVIDPQKDFNDFEIKDGKKRVMAACFDSECDCKCSDGSRRRFSSSGYKMQTSCPPGERYVCSNEYINIYIGVCAYCIEMPQFSRRMWINALSGKFYGMLGFGRSDEGAFDLGFWGVDSVGGWLQLSKLAKGDKKAYDVLKEVLSAARCQDVKNQKVGESTVSESGSKPKKFVGDSNGKRLNSSLKKRWKFIMLGLLFGWMGAHYMYAKRKFLLLLLWTSFITGVAMIGSSQSDVRQPAQDASVEVAKKSSNGEAIGGGCLALWALLWLGGTLFVKKDGKGNRM